MFCPEASQLSVVGINSDHIFSILKKTFYFSVQPLLLVEKAVVLYFP